MAFLVTTTGTLTPVVFDDIGGRSVPHPTVNLDLSLEFSTTEISESADIQFAIDNGHIIVTDGNGKPITDASAPVISAAAIPWSFRKSYTDESGKPYVESEEEEYEAVSVFMFPGTSSGAGPDVVKVVASSKDSNGDVGIRIIDVSSIPPVIVSEDSSLSVLKDDPMVYVLPSPTNLPASESVFQIQIKQVTTRIRLHDILILES